MGSAVSKAKSIASRSNEDKDVFADDAPAAVSTGTYVKVSFIATAKSKLYCSRYIISCTIIDVITI